MEKAGGEWKFRVGYAFPKRYDFNFDLKEASEFAERTSSGRSFQIIAESYGKLSPKCFRDLKTEAKWGTSRNMPSYCYMHYVWVSKRVQNIWGYHCVRTYKQARQSWQPV